METNNVNNVKNQLLGKWELENGGPIVHLEEGGKLEIQGQAAQDKSYLLENDGGLILLTIPDVIERSEVISVTATELVVKEFEQGSPESRVRIFRKM